MSEPSRILHPGLRQKIMSADAAAALIEHGDHVGMSGFTGAGYPKAVPQALAKHIEQANQGGNKFRMTLGLPVAAVMNSPRRRARVVCGGVPALALRRGGG